MPGSGRITPADRLVVDTVELRRHTGTRRAFVATAAFPDLSAGAFSVVDGRLDVDLTIEAVTEGVTATGVVRGTWTGPCRRCLEPIEAELVIDLHEIFERHPTDGETWPIEDERIDLAPVVREAALLALPLAPLCREECAGPEPDRFPTLVAPDPEPTVEPPTPDPRWAALADLRFDDDR